MLPDRRVTGEKGLVAFFRPESCGFRPRPNIINTKTMYYPLKFDQ